MGEEGKVLLLRAAISAPFPARQTGLPAFLLLPYRNGHAGIRDGVAIQKQGQPGNAPLILRETNSGGKVLVPVFLCFGHRQGVSKKQCNIPQLKIKNNFYVKV
jgi:hypothetical protein